VQFEFWKRLTARRPVVTPTGTYTDVRFPPVDGGYRSFEWNVAPRTDPSPDGFFWSNQFSFERGDQAYCGLQTHNAEFGGKIAIFSVWSAIAADGPGFADPFGGEGTGFSVRVAYDWRVDTCYRLSVSHGHDDTSARWWRAQVTDTSTGTSANIGSIATRPTWGRLNASTTMWSERYSGPMNTCGDIRHSVVDFTDPTADDMTVAAINLRNHLADPPTCPNSRIEPLPNGSRHRMGVGSEPHWPG